LWGYNILWKCDSYIKLNGENPSEEFITSLPVKDRAVVRSKIVTLGQEGTLLMGTHMLERIQSLSKKEKQDKDLYELVCGKYRIGTYFDSSKQSFILLCGWKKTKKIQPDDIKHCRALLHEYLD